MKLFRLVGEKEFRLIQQSGFKSFPARMSGQHELNPVLNKKYAVEMASKRSIMDNNHVGRNYVLEFEVDDNYISWFETKTVGGHQELSIPAEQIDEFNSHLNGLISVVGVFEK
jgi:hypothetical protein